MGSGGSRIKRGKGPQSSRRRGLTFWKKGEASLVTVFLVVLFILGCALLGAAAALWRVRGSTKCEAEKSALEPSAFLDPVTIAGCAGMWFRTDQGTLVRLIHAEGLYGELVDQGGLVGSYPLARLRPLLRMEAGEWWTIRGCRYHPADHGFGTLPFRVPGSHECSRWSDGSPDLVACGCAVPDDTEHPQA